MEASFPLPVVAALFHKTELSHMQYFRMRRAFQLCKMAHASCMVPQQLFAAEVTQLGHRSIRVPAVPMPQLFPSLPKLTKFLKTLETITIDTNNEATYTSMSAMLQTLWLMPELHPHLTYWVAGEDVLLRPSCGRRRQSSLQAEA